MEVCFPTSGERFTVLEDDLQGQTAKAVKKALAAKVGISRFKQRCFVEDGSREIQDDEVLDPAPLKIQLVVLEFWPPDDEETEKMISTSRDNDLVAISCSWRIAATRRKSQCATLGFPGRRSNSSRATRSLSLDVEIIFSVSSSNVANKDGKTPMFRAAEEGHVQLMEVLLEAGAKTDEPEFRGRTPLFAAARNDHLNAVRFLVENGAAKDQGDNDGETPLWVAARNGHLNVVRFLAEVGAAKDRTANNGATPLLRAAQYGYLDIARLLVEHGAAKDQADNYAIVICFIFGCTYGATPLLRAAQNGHPDIVRFLLEHGAAKDQADSSGYTPLLLAAQNGHHDIVRFLVVVGALA